MNKQQVVPAEAGQAPTIASEQDASLDECSRIARLLKMVQEIRNEPRQSLQNLLHYFSISRSQFYKDKTTLASVGFQFQYSKVTGFHITEDRLTPVTGLSLSDRLILMFALEHLSTTGEGHLAARAVEIGRKLAGGLEETFREQLLSCFDRQVTGEGFGVQPEILNILREAITEGRRISMLYQRSEDWSTRWREIEPRRIYLRQRTLYLYARTMDEKPAQWKVFRLGRIQEIRPTGICMPRRPDEDDGFHERMRNAFIAFIGDERHKVTIRFTGNAKHYLKERYWHHSQQLSEEQDGSVLFTVEVAEAKEVVRWAQQFGSEAELVSIGKIEEQA